MELIARLGDREERLELVRQGDTYRVRVSGRDYEVEVARFGGTGRSLLIQGGDARGGAQHEVVVRAEQRGRYLVSAAGGSHEVEVLDPLTHLALEAHGPGDASGAERATAYMPGRVVSLLVEEGTTVEQGQGILVLEAMKMENEIRAERAGTVREIFVETGQSVETGDPLFVVE